MINEISDAARSRSSTADGAMKSKTLRSRYTRNFFVGMAWSFILLTILGFVPDYVMMHTMGITAHWFSHVHGVLMSLWLLLFLVQAVLARKGNFKLHRQLGLMSVGLGIVIWISMFIVSMRPRIVFPGPVDDERSDVLLIAIHGIIFFALFFVWGMLQRKEAATHKRLMVLASIAVMQASIDRVVRFIPESAFFVRFVVLDLLLLAPLILYDLFTVKRIHKVTLIGGALLIAGQIAEVTAFATHAWHKMAFAIFQPFVDPIVEVKLTDDQIASLVGNYGNEGWHTTVSYDGGKLYLKLPDVPIFEMIATSAYETSLTTMAWRVSFIRDKDGRIVKIIHTQPDVVWEQEKMELGVRSQE